MYFVTSDEHFGHVNILKYCNRPFENVHEMNKAIIDRHNEVVDDNDTVIHAGDFTMGRDAHRYISKLNGNHIFLEGSHDKWMGKHHNNRQILEIKIQGTPVIICHYCMRTWARSHYNSWHLFGHSHGRLESLGKSHDIGVDGNNFYPYNEIQIAELMKKKPDNFNLIKKNSR